jgi:glycosyltransferase involved in cell wall biosynthesis
MVVAFIGRLVRHKGLVELCGAWTSLRSVHPGVHLLIVGQPEPQDPVPQETLEVFRGDPRVHLTGLCEEMPTLYAAADLVVLPSYYEGFPTVLLEAAAMSLPVVASAIPGNMDAVRDNETGSLFDLNEPPSLVRAIARYVVDPDLRRRHGTQARCRVLRDFRPEPIREFILSDYGSILSQRGLPANFPESQNEAFMAHRKTVA